MNSDYWSCFVLYGSKGSGKTHLAHLWQKFKKGRFLEHRSSIDDTIHEIVDSNAVIIENIDSIKDEEWLLHCFNYSRENNRSLLLTTTVAPKALNFKLKDLESRILSAMSAKLADPNEELLRIMLVKLFTDRQLHTDIKTINYILNNVERSFKKLSDIVNLIDNELTNTSGSVTIPFVRSIIQRSNCIRE